MQKMETKNDTLKKDNVSIIKVTSDESYDWTRTVALGFSRDGTANLKLLLLCIV